MAIMPTILASKSDHEILTELGTRLGRYRLQQNLTATEVASRAGVNRNTVINAEAGKNPRLGTVIRLLRVYRRIEAVEAFLPPPGISPLELAETAGRGRQRARRRRDG